MRGAIRVRDIDSGDRSSASDRVCHKERPGQAKRSLGWTVGVARGWVHGSYGRHDSVAGRCDGSASDRRARVLQTCRGYEVMGSPYAWDTEGGDFAWVEAASLWGDEECVGEW